MTICIQNVLVIHKKYRKILLDKFGDLDFEKLVPMPKSMDIPAGGLQEEAIAIYLYKERGETAPIEKRMNRYVGFENGNIEEFVKYFENLYSDEYSCSVDMHFPTLLSLGKAYVKNREAYGAYNWKDWREKAWGCNQNAYCCKVAENGDLLTVYFNTNWSAPNGWLQKLSEFTPFYLEWISDQGRHGEVFCSEAGHTKIHALSPVECGYEIEKLSNRGKHERDVLAWESNWNDSEISLGM